MNIEKITSRIIGDANQQAETLLREAKLKADSILSEANERAEVIKSEAVEKGSVEKDKLILRRKAVAEIDGRKIVLAEKQKVIDKCFEEAEEKIINLDRDTYSRLISEKIAATGSVSGEIILNEKDKAELGEKIEAQLKTLVSGSNFTISQETRNIKGGFILKEGSIYMNGTVENLVEDVKDTLISEVASKLFE